MNTTSTIFAKLPHTPFKNYVFILAMLFSYTAQSQASGVDLELSMTQTIENPTAFSQFSRTVELTNTGTAAATNIQISIPLLPNMVFTGGNEYVASLGSFSAHGQQMWTLNNLAPGQSENILLNYFPLTDIINPGYA